MTLSEADIDTLFQLVKENEGIEFVVDLEQQTVNAGGKAMLSKSILSAATV